MHLFDRHGPPWGCLQPLRSATSRPPQRKSNTTSMKTRTSGNRRRVRSPCLRTAWASLPNRSPSRCTSEELETTLATADSQAFNEQTERAVSGNFPPDRLAILDRFEWTPDGVVQHGGARSRELSEAVDFSSLWRRTPPGSFAMPKHVALVATASGDDDRVRQSRSAETSWTDSVSVQRRKRAFHWFAGVRVIPNRQIPRISHRNMMCDKMFRDWSRAACWQLRGVELLSGHPNKHIRAAINYAQQQGWRFIKAGSQAHIYGKILCPRRDRDGCSYNVLSTPRDSESHARRIRRRVDACPH